MYSDAKTGLFCIYRSLFVIGSVVGHNKHTILQFHVQILVFR